jgi:hypothetical protein
MGKYTGYDELDAPAKSKSAKKRPRRASLLGLLGVLVGLVAIAVTQRAYIQPWLAKQGVPHSEYMTVVENYWVDPYHVAGAGGGLAIFALLLRSMTGRTRAGWPVLALLLSAGAAGTWRYETTPKDPGTPERWVRDNVVDRVDRWIHPPTEPGVQPAPRPQEQTVSTPATAPSTDAGNSGSTRPAAPRTPADTDPPEKSAPNQVFKGL